MIFSCENVEIKSRNKAGSQRIKYANLESVSNPERGVSVLGLRFILGRAGEGKTQLILDNIRQALDREPDGAPIVLLVPEQATFQMEYALTTASGRGLMRAQVLSFRRLAYRVLTETGGAARIPIGELGKRMVLRELLERHKTSLRVFGKSANRPGFADCLARTIGEMKTYLINPGNLENACGFLDQTAVLLKDKLFDLALLYKELQHYLEPRYTDPDDLLSLLAEKIVHANFFKDAEFWIDGFKGFTPQEIAVLEKILQVAGEVNIALTMDKACLTVPPSADTLFFPTWETFVKLTRAAEKTCTQIHDPVILEHEPPLRFNKSPDLAFLERHMFSYPAPKFNGASGSIKIVAAANRRAEVEACAREIIRLVRDNGYRWRDIAVLLRDLEPYHELISNIFRDYDIPLFIDRKRYVMHHPLIELIRSALEVVIKNWAYEPVFRYLKTDLVPVDRENVFKLENYVLAHGIRGSKWTAEEEWTYLRRYTLGEDAEAGDQDFSELAEINKYRRESTAALSKFCRDVSEANTVREITTALYKLLEELRAAETIERWRIDAEKAGHLEKAREHGQIWSSVAGLFDEVVEALGHEVMPIETYASILDTGFESMTIGLIPPGLDQVMAGSLDRSRNPDIKAAFLLGVSDGVLPAGLSDDGVFNLSERDKLEAIGINMAPSSKKRVFEEQFLVYTALTRASERLWMSYPMADDEGRAMMPSQVIARIKELIPGLAENIIRTEPAAGDAGESLEFLVHQGMALTYLAGVIREFKTGTNIAPVWWDLYNWFMDEKWKDSAISVLRSVFHTNREKNISPGTSHLLYGRRLKASVSRIEKFNTCPFAHFSLYGLRLKERDVFRLEAPDLGEFFHAALKCFAEELQRTSTEWGDLSPDECRQLNNKIVDRLAPQLQSEILLSTARYRYLTGKLKKAVNRAAVVLAEHSRRSAFRPVGLEISFGQGGQLQPVTINLPDGSSLELTGRIDRLDVARAEKETYLRVIDYKSSDNRINLEEIYYGLRLQLLTYLHVALAHYSSLLGQEVKPAGILYFTVREPLIQANGPMSGDDVEKAVLASLKMRGFLLADRDVVRMMDNMLDRGHSELIQVALKNDGTFYSNAPVLDMDQFKYLRSYLEKQFAYAGEQIITGNVSIAPYRSGRKHACRYCSFKPVCQFDLLLEGNMFRALQPVNKDNIWNMMAGKEGNHE